eukprot:Nk52_evm44s2039 gene=Nk52_evmTU44s2039
MDGDLLVGPGDDSIMQGGLEGTRANSSRRDTSMAVKGFDSDLQYVLGCIRKGRARQNGDKGEDRGQKGQLTGKGKHAMLTMSHLAQQLGEFWNKYQNHLPPDYFNEKLVSVGDLLSMQLKEYFLAKNQCYSRYLNSILPHYNARKSAQDDVGEGGEEDMIEEETNYFFAHDSLKTTICKTRAVFGKAYCKFQMTMASDPSVQNPSTIKGIKVCFELIQKAIHSIMMKEELCWLCYNGTIQIYSMARPLIVLGFSAQVLRYLLWACMTMESIIPLMTAKYLPWRMTLYSAVFEAYHDLKAPDKAHEFAERTLEKIHEIEEIEREGCSTASDTTAKNIAEAHQRVALMLFKQKVFKPPKVDRARYYHNVNVENIASTAGDVPISLPSKPIPKLDANHVAKVIKDSFSTPTQIFTGIVEALKDTSRRVLKYSPPPGDKLVVYRTLVKTGMDIYNDPKTEISIGLKYRFAEVCFTFMFWKEFEIIYPTLLVEAGNGTEQASATMTKALEIMHAVSLKVIAAKQEEVIQPEEKEDDEEKEEKTDTANDDNKRTESPSLDSAGNIASKKKGTLTKAKSNRAKQKDDKANEKRFPKKAVSKLESKKSSLKKEKSVEADQNAADASSKSKEEEEPESSSIVETVKEPAQDHLKDLYDILKSCLSPDLHFLKEMIPDILVDATFMLIEAIKPELARVNVGMDEENLSISETTLNHTLLVIGLNNWLNVFSCDPVLCSCISLKAAIVLEKREGYKEALSILDSCKAKIGNYTAIRGLKCHVLNSISSDILYLSKAVTDKSKATVYGFSDKILDCLLCDIECIAFSIKLKLAGSEIPDKDDVKKNCLVKKKESLALNDQIAEEVGKNYQLKGIVYGLIAGSEQKKQKQEAYLKESIKNIHKGHELENKLGEPLATDWNPCNVESDEEQIPAPILSKRTLDSVRLRPTKYLLGLEKIEYFKIYGKVVTGGSRNFVSQLDSKLSGTDDFQKRSSSTEFYITNLACNEMYTFALCAYDSSKNLIGQISASTSPVTTLIPLPSLYCLGFISQMAFKCKSYATAKHVHGCFWTHFVDPAEQEMSYSIYQTGSIFFESAPKVNFPQYNYCLNDEHVSNAALPVLRMFIQSTLIYVHLIQEKDNLTFSNVYAEGPIFESQIARLDCALKLMVALDVACYLNDAYLIYQLIYKCFVLLSPLIFLSITSPLVLQVMQHCHNACITLNSSLTHAQQEVYFKKLHTFSVFSFYIASSLVSLNYASEGSTLVENSLNLAKMSSSSFNFKIVEKALKAYIETAEGKLSAIKSTDKKLKEKLENELRVDDKEMRLFEEACLVFKIPTAMAHSRDVHLNDNDDPVVLFQYLSFAPAEILYRELVKLKKKTRYVELAVKIIKKAVAEGNSQQAASWCSEVVTFVKKRNQGILYPKNVEPEVEDSKAKPTLKIKTLAKRDALNANEKRVKEKERLRQREIRRKNQRQRKEQGENGDKPLTEEEIAQQELYDEAKQMLQSTLPPFWKQIMNRRKLRASSLEEIPWRAELSLQWGLALLETFVQLFNKEIDASFLTAEYETSASNNEEPQKVNSNFENTRDPEIDTELLSFEHVGSMVSTGIEVSLPDTEKLDISEAPKTAGFSIPSVQQILSHFSRAVVLAARGKYWKMVDNICRHMWSANKIFTCSPISRANDESGNEYRNLYRQCWEPFYLAAWSVLDMLDDYVVKGHKIEDILFSGSQYRNEDDVKFMPEHEEHNAFNLNWIKQFMFHTISLLFDNAKWEKLIILIRAFNRVTKNTCGLTVLPILVHAFNRVQGGGGLSNQDISNFKSVLVKYSRDQNFSLQMLRNSRRLLTQYLAGHLNPNHAMFDKSRKVTILDPKDSRIGMKNNDEDQNNSEFQVEYPPLPANQLRTVVESYERTISMLEKKREGLLVVQALNELGDIMFHKKNIRAAAKHWSKSLDILFQTKNMIENWEETVCFTNELKGFKANLDKYGLWKCLIGACISAKLAKYSLSHSLEKRLRISKLSGALYTSILFSSLPHPHRYQDYIFYVPEGIIPGVDFFSEKCKVNFPAFLSGLEFVYNEYCVNGMYLESLPLISLYQQLSQSRARNCEAVIRARITRLDALIEMGLFTEAFAHFRELMRGNGLVRLSNEAHRAPLQEHESLGGDGLLFGNKGIEDPENTEALKFLIEGRLDMELVNIFRPYNYYYWIITQAKLLTALASAYPHVSNQVRIRATQETYLPTKSKLPQPRKEARRVSVKQIVTKARPQVANLLKESDNTKIKLSKINKLTPKTVDLDQKTNLLNGAMKLLREGWQIICNRTCGEGYTEDDIPIDKLSIVELSAVVMIRLQTAMISHHYHETSIAIQTLISVMGLMEEIFEQKKGNPNEEVSKLTDILSYEKVNMYMWIRVRELLIRDLLDKCQYDVALKQCELGMDDLRKSEAAHLQGKFLFYKTLIDIQKGDYSSAQQSFHKITSLMQANRGDTEGLAEVYSVYGEWLAFSSQSSVLDNLNEAIRSFKEGERILTQKMNFLNEISFFKPNIHYKGSTLLLQIKYNIAVCLHAKSPSLGMKEMKEVYGLLEETPWSLPYLEVNAGFALVKPILEQLYTDNLPADQIEGLKSKLEEIAEHSISSYYDSNIIEECFLALTYINLVVEKDCAVAAKSLEAAALASQRYRTLQKGPSAIKEYEIDKNDISQLSDFAVVEVTELEKASQKLSILPEATNLLRVNYDESILRIGIERRGITSTTLLCYYLLLRKALTFSLLNPQAKIARAVKLHKFLQETVPAYADCCFTDIPQLRPMSTSGNKLKGNDSLYMVWTKKFSNNVDPNTIEHTDGCLCESEGITCLVYRVFPNNAKFNKAVEEIQAKAAETLAALAPAQNAQKNTKGQRMSVAVGQQPPKPVSKPEPTPAAPSQRSDEQEEPLIGFKPVCISVLKSIWEDLDSIYLEHLMKKVETETVQTAPTSTATSRPVSTASSKSTRPVSKEKNAQDESKADHVEPNLDVPFDQEELREKFEKCILKIKTYIGTKHSLKDPIEFQKLLLNTESLDILLKIFSPEFAFCGKNTHVSNFFATILREETEQPTEDESKADSNQN